MAEFTHFNEEGRAKMVDVSDKPKRHVRRLLIPALPLVKKFMKK